MLSTELGIYVSIDGPSLARKFKIYAGKNIAHYQAPLKKIEIQMSGYGLSLRAASISAFEIIKIKDNRILKCSGNAILFCRKL